MERQKFTVEKNFSGNLIDYLQSVLAAKLFPRHQINAMILTGQVAVNQKVMTRPTFKVRSDDRIDLLLMGGTHKKMSGNAPTTALGAASLAGAAADVTGIEILYEDDWLVVVNKPAFLPSQPTLDPSRPDLYSWLKQKYFYVGLHHRLDLETSGVLLYTKKTEANAGIAEQFRLKRIQKTYAAVLDLNHPGSAFHETASIEVQNYLKKSKQKDSSQEVVTSGGDYAETQFKCLAKKADRPDAQSALVLAQPKTGRTHQIRVHAKGLFSPIVGDKKYTLPSVQLDGPRVLLHAAILTFTHPIHNQLVTVNAPLPDDFLKWLNTHHYPLTDLLPLRDF